MQAPSIHTKAVSAEATDKARTDSLLSPRFYTTDFAALEKIDVSPVRAEWDAVMAEYEGDNNHDHFQRDAAFAEELKSLPARVAPGVHRLPDQLDHERVLRLRALQRDPQECAEPGR